MNGIYLTEEGKQELMARIARDEELLICQLEADSFYLIKGRILLMKEILSSSTIIPIEESWDKLFPCSWNSIGKDKIKNGVIIQPKQ